MADYPDCALLLSQAKVGDMGLSRRLGLGSVSDSDGYGPFPWMSPESLQPPFSVSRASDAYMFGVCLWEAFESVHTKDVCLPWGPGSTRTAVAERLLRGETLVVSKHATTDVGAFIRRCLSVDATARPSMPEACAALETMAVKPTQTGGAISTSSWPRVQRSIVQTGVPDVYVEFAPPPVITLPAAGEYDSWPVV